ncbi:transmembrane protein 268 isoform 2-T2 [Discoglossus pictus]
MTRQDGDYEPGSNEEKLHPRMSSGSGLYNGRLLTVLPYTSRAEHTEQCLASLRDCGIHVPLEQCRDSLQISPLIPELRRYIFFSSRGFGMVLGLILYISLWINLYSTVQMFTEGHGWVTSIPVTLAAAAITAVVIVIINRHHKKINVNTDIRLAAANEIFMEHNVLLGISEETHKCQSVPFLCFIYFHLRGCQQRLAQHLANLSRDDLRSSLDKLFIVIEIPVDPALAEGATVDPTSEESPLLASNSEEKPILCSKKIPLILEGEPEVMAQQLLVISSACYVRLLISGRLPSVREVGHANIIHVPCPCQFIEESMLKPGCCS